MPSEEGAALSRGRPGGRTARVRQDVLDATLRHVAVHGLDGLTIAAIATAAGVAQTTVYRRWPTPPALVADALGELATHRNPMPDNGDIRLDLQQLIGQIIDLLSEPALARLVGASLALASDPDVAAARKLFWTNRFDLSAEVVARAVRRGQLRPDSDPREVIETLVAPLYLRILVTDQPVGDDFGNRCVEDVLTLYRVG